MKKQQVKQVILKILGFIGKTLEYILPILLILLAWYFAGKDGDIRIKQAKFPTLAALGRKVGKLFESGKLLQNTWISLRRVLTGYIIAAAVKTDDDKQRLSQYGFDRSIYIQSDLFFM